MAQVLPINDQGFENNSLNGWTANGNCSLAVSSTKAHTGTYSMAITSTASGATKSYGPNINWGTLNEAYGYVAILTVWVYNSYTSGLTCNIGLDAHYSGGFDATISAGSGSKASKTISPNTWTQLLFRGVMPWPSKGGDHYYFLPTAGFTATAASQVVYYDDFSLLVTNGYQMMGMGAG